jgi:hypothetical protein
MDQILKNIVGVMKMNDKQQILVKLTEVFNHWQELLASLTDEQITTPLLPSTWTVKDIVAHMWAWQQASVARVEAALQGREPLYPRWREVNGPDPEEDLDRTNDWIYAENRDRLWSSVYADWKGQFQRYLEILKQVPEKDLFQVGRFAWMGTYPLSASPIASCEHHQEHLDSLLAWLKEQGL